MPRIVDANVHRIMKPYPNALRLIDALVQTGSQRMIKLGKIETPIGSGILEGEHIPNVLEQYDGFRNTALAFLNCIGSLKDGPQLLLAATNYMEPTIDIHDLIGKFATTSMRECRTPWTECQNVQEKINRMDNHIAISIGWFLRGEAQGPRDLSEDLTIGTIRQWLSEGTVRFDNPSLAEKLVRANLGVRVRGIELEGHPHAILEHGGIFYGVNLETVVGLGLGKDGFEAKRTNPYNKDIDTVSVPITSVKAVSLTSAPDPELEPDSKLANS